MGELNFFLGFHIKQEKDEIFIDQGENACELVKKFKMKKSKEMSSPMSTSTKLDKDANSKSVDEKLYRGMIDSLLYLTASRPDIIFSVCLYARFQASPKEFHLHVVI